MAKMQKQPEIEAPTPPTHVLWCERTGEISGRAGSESEAQALVAVMLEASPGETYAILPVGAPLAA